MTDAQWHDVCRLDELPEGASGHRLDTSSFVLVRQGDRVDAVEPLCPHKFAALEEGTVVDGCLVCPQHDAHFDPTSGEPRTGDEWAGRLRPYRVRVHDGVVQMERSS